MSGGGGGGADGGAGGVAVGGSVHGAGEGGGEVGVEADDAADVVVELPDEADVAGEVVGRPGLVVLVDLADEHPVLVQQALHLHEALVERLDQLPVHRLPAAVRHGAGVAVPLHGDLCFLLALLSLPLPPHRLTTASPGLNIHQTNRIKTIDLAGARKI